MYYKRKKAVKGLTEGSDYNWLNVFEVLFFLSLVDFKFILLLPPFRTVFYVFKYESHIWLFETRDSYPSLTEHNSFLSALIKSMIKQLEERKKNVNYV